MKTQEYQSNECSPGKLLSVDIEAKKFTKRVSARASLVKRTPIYYDRIRV